MITEYNVVLVNKKNYRHHSITTHFLHIGNKRLFWNAIKIRIKSLTRDTIYADMTVNFFVIRNLSAPVENNQ